MDTTMMQVPLSLNHLLERAGQLFHRSEIVSRRPDKSLVRHSYGEFYRRTRSLASAFQRKQLQKGERVATLCWNHHAHLEAYFGIPAAGGVMHTLNLRLSPEEIGWIAADAQDRFLLIDDVLLPLYEQFKHLHQFEEVIVIPFSGAPVPAGFTDYEALRASADPDGFRYATHDENDPVSMCYTSGTTGKPKGVVYSHRSTVLHTLVASLADFWGLRGTDVVMPVTPMFHANSWGIPYGAVMLGAKLVMPGPHLHPDDLLDLMQQEPPTLALGVPTIWLGLIQAYEASLATASPNHGRWKLPQGMRSLVGGAAVPESLIRAFDRHGVWILQGWGMTETSPVATISYIKSELVNAPQDERYRRAAMAGVPVPLVELRARRRRPGPALGRRQRRRSPGARTVHHRQLFQRRLARGQIQRRRLVAHRRRGQCGRHGLRAHQRPHQGFDQIRRRMDQLGRSGKRADGPPRRGRSRRHRHSGREMERAAPGLRRLQARPKRHAGRTEPAAHRQRLRQMAAARALRNHRRRPTHLHRQVL